MAELSLVKDRKRILKAGEEISTTCEDKLIKTTPSDKDSKTRKKMNQLLNPWNEVTAYYYWLKQGDPLY